jgi:cell division protein FtsB
MEAAKLEILGWRESHKRTTAELAKRDAEIAELNAYLEEALQVVDNFAVTDEAQHKQIAALTAELTKRDAEIARLTKINSDLCRTHNQHVIQSARDAEVIDALTAERDALAANVKVLREALEGLLNFGNSNNVDVVKGRFNTARQSLEQTK